MKKHEQEKNTEQKILDAAKEIFQEKGLHGARMQEIADKAVTAIQDPLEKARKAAEIVEQHNQQTEKDTQNMK